MKKFIISLVFLFTCVMSVSAFATEYIYDGEGFKKMSDNPDGTYVLANDILISGDYIPFDFSGVFDGNGHTITLNLENESSKTSLFANLEGAIIENFDLNGEYRISKVTSYAIVLDPSWPYNFNGTGYTYTGSIASKCDGDTVIRYVNNELKSSASAAIVYDNAGVITGCTSSASNIVNSNSGLVLNCITKDRNAECSGYYENYYTASEINTFVQNYARYMGTIPETNNRDFIIYKEAYRGDRIELALFDVEGTAPTYINWNDSIELDDNIRYKNADKYFLNTNGEWEFFESGYDRISNSASEILTSSLNVFDAQKNKLNGIKSVGLTLCEDSSIDNDYFVFDAVVGYSYFLSDLSSYNPYVHSVLGGGADCVYQINGKNVEDMEWTTSGTLHGYKNSNGDQVIPNIYTEISPFFNGCAAALLNIVDESGEYTKKWGMIDKYGNIVVPFEHDYVSELYSDSDRIYSTAVSYLKPTQYYFSHSTPYRLYYNGQMIYERERYPRNFRLGRMAVNGKYVVHKKYVWLYANGKYVNSDVTPQIVEDRTMVPIRTLCEKMGCAVEWNDQTETAKISKGSRWMELTIGWDYAQSSNGAFNLMVSPRIISDRTFITLRDTAEFFNFNVDWDEELYVAYIKE